KDNASKYRLVLEMLRLSPSAANTQPWRIIKQNDGYDLYVIKDNRGERHVINCNYNDVGIAMCHFEMTAEELGLTGEWKIDPLKKNIIEYKLEYVSSWKII
ncbi:MAG: nitroreductase family protein, partial [Candidatus Heimdallarchaeaceae archaeon]